MPRPTLQTLPVLTQTHLRPNAGAQHVSAGAGHSRPSQALNECELAAWLTRRLRVQE